MFAGVWFGFCWLMGTAAAAVARFWWPADAELGLALLLAAGAECGRAAGHAARAAARRVRCRRGRVETPRRREFGRYLAVRRAKMFRDEDIDDRQSAIYAGLGAAAERRTATFRSSRDASECRQRVVFRLSL